MARQQLQEERLEQLRETVALRIMPELKSIRRRQEASVRIAIGTGFLTFTEFFVIAGLILWG